MCSDCGTRPRAAGGRIPTCLPCLKLRAETDRVQRERIAAAYAARKAAELPTKKCRACKTEKPVDSFATNRNARDGFRRDCKSCVADGKAKKQTMTPEQKLANKAKRALPHRKAANYQSVQKWQARNPEAKQAWKEVKKAVENGGLKLAKVCQAIGCKRRDRLSSHHNSYHPSYRKRIVRLCPHHHRHVHNGRRVRLKKGAAFRVARQPETH